MNHNIIKLAIADDHDLVRQGLINLLNSFENIEVIADAANGRELIAAIKQLKELPDITILDINMPELNGYDTLLILKKTYPAMRFLALTMIEKEYSVIRMIKNGANGYILKGCRVAEMQEAIITIYTDEYYYNNTASERAFIAIENYQLPKLSEKEKEFIQLCCSQLSYSKIADIMNVSVHTVHGYQKSVGEKLNIHNRIGLAMFAIHTGLIPMDYPQNEVLGFRRS